MTPSRRALLKALGAAGAMAPWDLRAFAQTRLADNPFRLGVASGPAEDDGREGQSDGVVLWTKLKRIDDEPFSTAPQPVGWELAADENFRSILRRGVVEARPELGHAVHVEVRGLAPDRWYFYRFLLGKAASATGRTRCLPALGSTGPDNTGPGNTGPGSAELTTARLALASCQWWQKGFYAAYRHMLADAPDAVLFAGDYIYEYPDGGDAVRRTGLRAKPVTLADYRRVYDIYRSDPHLQAMHAACPWVLTWDDHEVYNDYAREQGEDLAANFLARKAAAYQAYYEYMPLPAACLRQGLAGLGTSAELRLYRRLSFGRLAQILVLDARQYKDAQVCPREGRGGSNTVELAACPDLDDPRRTLLGPSQEQWLQQQLARAQGDAQPVWTLMLQQSLVSPRVFSGRRVWTDGWDGYPAARQRLIDLLAATRPNNPVLLGGDVHETYVSHLHQRPTDPASPIVAAEFCGTSITSPSNTRPEDMPGRLRNNPHMLYGDPAHRGYLLLDLQPARLTAHARILDDATREDARISTSATFALEAGQPRIHRI